MNQKIMKILIIGSFLLAFGASSGCVENLNGASYGSDCLNLGKIDLDDITKKANNAGYTVEHNVNVLLKFLFGNYLAIGGRNKPDGLLGFEGDLAYVIDSKQHQELEKGEFVKLRDYVHSYLNEENLYYIKGGVLVICKKILKSNSLNPSSREEVLKDTDIFIYFRPMNTLPVPKNFEVISLIFGSFG